MQLSVLKDMASRYVIAPDPGAAGLSRGVAGASGVVEREMVLGYAFAQRSFGPVSCDSARRATGEGEGERCRVDRDVSVHAARTHAGMLAA